MRIYYRVWGEATERLGLWDSYAMMRADDLSSADAVVRSLERRSDLVCCTGPSFDGMAVKDGRFHEQQYHCSLGRPARRGGFNVVGEVWFAVAVEGPVS